MYQDTITPAVATLNVTRLTADPILNIEYRYRQPTCMVDASKTVTFPSVAVPQGAASGAAKYITNATAPGINITCSGRIDGLDHTAEFSFAGTPFTNPPPGVVADYLLSTTQQNLYIIGHVDAWSGYTDAYCDDWGNISGSPTNGVKWNGDQMSNTYFNNTILATGAANFVKNFTFALCSYGPPEVGTGTATATYTVLVN